MAIAIAGVTLRWIGPRVPSFRISRTASHGRRPRPRDAGVTSLQETASGAVEGAGLLIRERRGSAERGIPKGGSMPAGVGPYPCMGSCCCPGTPNRSFGCHRPRIPRPRPSPLPPCRMAFIKAEVTHLNAGPRYRSARFSASAGGPQRPSGLKAVRARYCHGLE